MNRQRRREPWTSEVPNNIQDARLVGGLPDEATQVRSVKLPVLVRSPKLPDRQPRSSF